MCSPIQFRLLVLAHRRHRHHHRSVEAFSDILTCSQTRRLLHNYTHIVYIQTQTRQTKDIHGAHGVYIIHFNMRAPSHNAEYEYWFIQISVNRWRKPPALIETLPMSIYTTNSYGTLVRPELTPECCPFQCFHHNLPSFVFDLEVGE